jgi:hypothetical protein
LAVKIPIADVIHINLQVPSSEELEVPRQPGPPLQNKSQMAGIGWAVTNLEF